MIKIETKKSVDVLDITALVEESLQDERIENGICLVYTLHTTTGLAVNEFDEALIKDILNLLEHLVPEGGDYHHNRYHSDGNADAHLRAMLLGNSVMIPIEKKKLIMGTWQRILFFELDGPRRRSICVKVAAN
jgi:secondary thiamine-phosphate synthase enzyme